MLYLSDTHIDRIGVDWFSLKVVMLDAARAYYEGQCLQPLKPYLHIGTENRIIAMPAYMSGAFPVVGIKWIASFPSNLEKKIPRAHAITILNDTETGVPICLINSTRLSALRTALVSILMIDRFLELTKQKKIRVGIAGFGEVGKTHLEALLTNFGDNIETIGIYDVNPNSIQFNKKLPCSIVVANSAEELLSKSTIFITCTTSGNGYISSKPPRGCLILNISLRDFKPTFQQFVDCIVVDEWSEVCRKGTDIEAMHLENGLTKAGTYSLFQILFENTLAGKEKDSVVMFNPMGLAIFDIAISSFYRAKALKENIGVDLQRELENKTHRS